jgi:membrane-bound ClpP family serine protease
LVESDFAGLLGNFRFELGRCHPDADFTKILARGQVGWQDSGYGHYYSLALMGYVLLFFEIFFSLGDSGEFEHPADGRGGLVRLYGTRAVLGDFFVFAVVALLAWLTVVIELQIISRTGLGKKLFLSQRNVAQSNTTDEIKTLVGKFGKTLTPMNLSGKVEVEGKSLEAQSLYEPLEVGVRVEVVEVGPNGLKVKKAQ